MKHHDLSFSRTERDEELFRYLFMTKGATRKQISRDIFGNPSFQAVCKRLNKLSKLGYIDRSSLWRGQSTVVYFVTRKALKEINFFDSKLQRLELKSSSMSHEVSLVDIRYKFYQFVGLIHYLTENELQSGLLGPHSFNYSDFIQLNSDAFSRIELQGEPYSGAIEYEQSDKGVSRYRELFTHYYLSDHVDFVFYVLKNQTLMNSILRYDRIIRERREPKIFCITLNDLLKSNHQITLINSHSGTLLLPLKENI